MKPFVFAIVSLLLVAASASAQESITVPILPELHDYGFVVKRVEVTTVLEKEEPAQPTAPATETTETATPPPLPPLPNTRPIPGPPDAGEDVVPIPGPAVKRPAPLPGNKWIQSRTTGKWYQGSQSLEWIEFANGDIRGCRPGNIIIYSTRQDEYFSVDPAFAYWDTDIGLVSTQKTNKLVRGDVTGDYYEIPQGSVLTETVTSRPSSAVAWGWRPALLPRNRWVPLTIQSNEIQMMPQLSGATDITPYSSGLPDNYNNATGCPGGSCGSCPGGVCPW